MADATAARRPASVPWSYRLIEAVPFPPIGVGVAIALVLLAAYLGVEVATGRLSAALARGDSSRILRGMSIVLVLLAYLPTAQVYLTRWTRRHVEALGPLLCDPVGAPAGSRTALASRWSRLGYRSANAILTRDDEVVHVREEEDLFRLIGLPWVPPEKREVFPL